MSGQRTLKCTHYSLITGPLVAKPLKIWVIRETKKARWVDLGSDCQAPCKGKSVWNTARCVCHNSILNQQNFFSPTCRWQAGVFFLSRFTYRKRVTDTYQGHTALATVVWLICLRLNAPGAVCFIVLFRPSTVYTTFRQHWSSLRVSQLCPSWICEQALKGRYEGARRTKKWPHACCVTLLALRLRASLSFHDIWLWFASRNASLMFSRSVWPSYIDNFCIEQRGF